MVKQPKPKLFDPNPKATVIEAEFIALCRAHDLTYMMSDDPAANRRGEAELVALRALANKLPRARAVALFNEHAVDRTFGEGEAGDRWYWSE